MNLSHTLRRIPIKLYNPETLDLRDRILAAGGSISSAALDDAEKFVQDCKNNNLWNKLTDVGLLVGDQLTAALVKLKFASGGQSTLTNINFVAGDYTESGANGGLLGNGSTKYLRTGLLQNSVGSTGHLSFYLRGDVSGATRVLLGCNSGTDNFFLRHRDPQNRAEGLWGGTTEASLSGTTQAGFWAVNRSSSTDKKLYKNGLAVASSSTPTTVNLAALEFYLFARNGNGTPSEYLNVRGSFYSIGQSLTDAEQAALYAAVQTLQNNLNRAV